MEFTNEQIEYLKSEEGQTLLNANGVVTKFDLDKVVETEEGLSNILKHSKVSAELDRRNSKSFEKFKSETLANYVEKSKLDEIENTYKTQLNETKIGVEIERALIGAKYPDLIASKIDKTTIKITENGVEGINEQIATLKEKYADLFEITPKGKVTPPAPGTNEVVKITKEQFAKMNIAEKTKLYLEDNETYTKLTTEV